jgi:hypothetical protein
MTMRHLLAILVLLAAIPLTYASGKKLQQTPGARTREFLDVHGQQLVLQEIKRIDRMRIFLSKDLHAALRAARVEQDTFVAAHPGDKPGLAEAGFNSGDGNAFDSYAIGLTNLLAKNRAAVDVEFVDNAQETTVRWKDRYEWVLEGGTWRLDDIVYRSTGRPGPRDKRLKTMLRSH